MLHPRFNSLAAFYCWTPIVGVAFKGVDSKLEFKLGSIFSTSQSADTEQILEFSDEELNWL